MHKLLLGFLLLLSANAFAQCPPNIGFEDGSFKNWECSIGNVDPNGIVTMEQTGGPYYTRQTIENVGGILDPYGGFSVLCPNGSKYSIRLGNSDTGHQAEQVAYTYKVPAGEGSTLVLNYAVVLQNPSNHAAYEQPRFTVKIHDITDNSDVPCPAFDFIASPTLPGFQLSTVQTTTGRGDLTAIYYKDWATTTINLEAYVGKTVRLEFTTNDCSRGGHFGYAYLDLNETCTTAITGSTYCNGQKEVTLRAPTGFNNYVWYKVSDTFQQVGQGPTLTLNPAPPNLAKYALIIYPFPGLGCVDTLYTTINRVGEDYKLVVADTVYGCKNTGADLTAPSVTAGSSTGMTYSYFTDSIATIYLAHPQAVDSGTYFIKGINAEGCLNVLPVHVRLHDVPIVTVTDPPPVQYPRTVDLTTVYKALQTYTYSFYKDAAATIPLTNYKSVGTSGTYYIKAINQFGCETITYTNIIVTPPPPYIISAPNVFTPNNDGVNDYFMIKIDGFVAFSDLKIFNRYGQLLYDTKSMDNLWDGKYNGHQLPQGTYYWVFEGTDQYFHNLVRKASSISIIR